MNVSQAMMMMMTNSLPRPLTHATIQERKYFDSGDYALSKAGKASDAGVTSIGHEHPDPEKIPHHTGPPLGSGNLAPKVTTNASGQNSSPVKESSFLHRETSASDMEDDETVTNDKSNS
jgi:hypothetical protein